MQDIVIHDEVCRASIVQLIMEDNASMCICGDGNEMAPSHGHLEELERVSYFG